MTDVMQGVRILEVAEHMFVPAASAILSDWGADVIKIEHHERGDAMRGLGSTGVLDLSQGVHVLNEHANRGKRSIGLDLSSEEGVVLMCLAEALLRIPDDHTADKLIADKMQTWMDSLMANIKAGDLDVHNDEMWDPSTWPKECKGVGFMEAPRGGLAHYIVIKDGKIDNYQAVVPSTWNAGPRDPSGQPGAYEAALMDNHTLAIEDQPLEIQRTIHSFDPCIACAVHVNDPDGEELVQVKVN